MFVCFLLLSLPFLLLSLPFLSLDPPFLSLDPPFLPLMEEKEAKEDQGLYRGRGSWAGYIWPEAQTALYTLAKSDLRLRLRFTRLQSLI